LGRVQRRGVHVNIPKIGSRVGIKCFGGISGFYAELRRECFWRNWNLVIFEVLVEGPRREVRRGDRCVFLSCVWGNLSVELGWRNLFCDLIVNGVTCGLGA
jgi:hypothetical protein